mmetsp:Transcript_12952/g.27249  ORF Transcript_12952/g.27249 Transcript_12952/m.27249 type:complete len:85 (+) Transcript_12952:1768-2022(+)
MEIRSSAIMRTNAALVRAIFYLFGISTRFRHNQYFFIPYYFFDQDAFLLTNLIDTLFPRSPAFILQSSLTGLMILLQHRHVLSG